MKRFKVFLTVTASLVLLAGCSSQPASESKNSSSSASSIPSSSVTSGSGSASSANNILPEEVTKAADGYVEKINSSPDNKNTFSYKDATVSTDGKSWVLNYSESTGSYKLVFSFSKSSNKLASATYMELKAAVTAFPRSSVWKSLFQAIEFKGGFKDDVEIQNEVLSLFNKSFTTKKSQFGYNPQDSKSSVLLISTSPFPSVQFSMD